MKAFWIKIISIAVIGVMIFMYQTNALSYSKMSKTIESLKTQIEDQQRQAPDASESDGTYESEDAGPEEGASAGYSDGTYEGEGTGYSGKLKVEVTVSGGKIADIKITETSDDQAYLGLASELIDSIIEKQSTDGIDTVSGATFSSRGILEAVSDALEGAAD